MDSSGALLGSDDLYLLEGLQYVDQLTVNGMTFSQVQTEDVAALLSSINVGSYILINPYSLFISIFG